MTGTKQTIRDAAALLIVILAALSVQISPNPEVVPTVNAAEAPTSETPLVWTVEQGTAPTAAVLRQLGELSELRGVRSDPETPCPPHIVVETQVERSEGSGAQRHQVQIRVVQPESRPEDEGCPKAGRA